MKYIDEYRDRKLAKELSEQISIQATRPMSFMEVCGGHTMAIHKFGLPSLLPAQVKLLSGPGCPVCVTSQQFVDKAVEYSRMDDVIVCSYGDLLRVPGSDSSLLQQKANGADVRIVYSVVEALAVAEANRSKKIIFLGIGFETTTPMSAAGILKAEEQQLKNFFLLSSHKVMPPAMAALIDEGVAIDGYVAPGHVSTVTGTSIYTAIASNFGKAVVISGFEPVDILQSILMLVRQVNANKPKVEIQYTRVVQPQGNMKAREMVNNVFEPCDDWWRGLGVLPLSGLRLKDKYKSFDAEINIPVSVKPSSEPKGCICGEILRGQKIPPDCKLFGTACNPVSPIGACMVSGEGACAAYYLYGNE